MPAKIYTDKDADLGVLKGKTLAVIGYLVDSLVTLDSATHGDASLLAAPRIFESVAEQVC